MRPSRAALGIAGLPQQSVAHELQTAYHTVALQYSNSLLECDF
jgi:hypothetical protein